MGDVKDVYYVALDCEQNPIHIRSAAVEKVTHFKRKRGILRTDWTSSRSVASDAIASSNARNHRIAASPAWYDTSHSKVSSASALASAEVSTRNAMLLPHLNKKFGGRAGPSGYYVLISVADALHGFLKVLMLPIEIGGQGVIECRGGVLASSTGYSSSCALRSGVMVIICIAGVRLEFSAFIVMHQVLGVNGTLVACQRKVEMSPFAPASEKCMLICACR